MGRPSSPLHECFPHPSADIPPYTSVNRSGFVPDNTMILADAVLEEQAVEEEQKAATEADN
jgi:hypothetical protein